MKNLQIKMKKKKEPKESSLGPITDLKKTSTKEESHQKEEANPGATKNEKEEKKNKGTKEQEGNDI
jgi:hypothetical protein